MRQELLNKVIEKLAKNFRITKNFEDIRVISSRDIETVALTNPKTKLLVLNINRNIMNEVEFIKCVEGMIIHEAGHIDNRLNIPATPEIMDEHLKKIKRAKIDKDLLNFVYDLEIHYQFEVMKRVRPKNRVFLTEFLNIVRDKIFKKDKDNLILSVKYPTTPLQKKIREIIVKRQWDVMRKVKEIDKLLKEDAKKKGGGKGKMIAEGKEGGSQGKGKKGKLGRQLTGLIFDEEKLPEKVKESIENAPDIKDKIKRQHGENEVRQKLKAMGFSDLEIKIALQRFDGSNVIDRVEDLDKSFKSVIPEINSEISKSKEGRAFDNSGYRIDGFRRIKDISEVVDNVEELMTIGQLDIEQMSVPIRIDRMGQGAVIIVRDTSGSVSSAPLDKMVRDITVSLIEIAKRRKYKVGVIDFHSQVEPFKDKNGNIMTTDYNILLMDSMMFKSGYSTRLSDALVFVGNLIKQELLDKAVSVFIVTDSRVDYQKGARIEGKKSNIIGIWTEDADEIDEDFVRVIKDHKGKLFQVSKVKEKLITKIFQEVK